MLVQGMERTTDLSLSGFVVGAESQHVAQAGPEPGDSPPSASQEPVTGMYHHT